MNRANIKPGLGGFKTAIALQNHLDDFEGEIVHDPQRIKAMKKLEIDYHDGRNMFSGIFRHGDDGDMIDWALMVATDEWLMPLFGITRDELIASITL